MARELGEAPRLLAYPYGRDPSIARRAAAAAGFEAAFTVRADLEWDGDPLSIPRVDPPGDGAHALHEPDEPTGFSVVVPACDRLGILADVVTRLASQTYPEDRYEVVVVDDGSRDDPAPIFAEMPANVRLVRQGDEAFRAGQARQRGADEARHDHLVFLDADVAVEPDFLWHLDWTHRRVPDAVVLGYLSGYNLHDLGYLHTPGQVRGVDLATLPIIPDRSREPTLRGCLDNLDWLEDPWPLTYTGNLSLPKALLARIGGFSDAFVGWGLEDVDLGVRLHRAGARFVFHRFAVGYHVVDPDESGWRNPFREREPTLDRFEGYLTNLAILERRHADDPAVQAYVARSRGDIEETCGRPMTVGIEMGGAASVRPPHHRRLHRVQPGGVPPEELFDRVAYADKIGARTIYLLGGAPAEHRAFLPLLERAREAVDWVSIETLAYPFAEPGRLEAAIDAGLRGVVIVVHALDRAPYEALHGPGTWDAFARGLAALERSDLERAAHLVVTEPTLDRLDETAAALRARELRVEEATVFDPTHVAAVRAATGVEPTLR
ncbi:MAG TPA: glycosyltransferase, partial [Sandaracinaceae bacterium LLY-WYZ-13_1]|nr:glycosyltransferase [Sandaracinaceae bacterium LLY-WYZ-13_1]